MSGSLAVAKAESRVVNQEFHASGIMQYSELISAEDSLNSWQLDHEFDYSAVSLSRVSNVKVWTDYQVICVYDDEHGMYEELSLFDDSFDFSCVSKTPIEHVSGKLALLPHLDPYNYYHWLIDTLPCFGVLELAGLGRLDIDRYYIHRMHSTFQQLHLKQLGIDPEQVMSRDDCVQHFSVDELIVPYFRMNGGAWPNPWFVDYLKKLWLTEQLANPATNDQDKSDNRIYVARGEARRMVSNEAQLIEQLVKVGYTIVEPHKLTIEEQAAHFAQADHVLGSHGAGLANLVFCKPGVQMMEFGGHYITGHFRTIAELSHVQYRSIAGGTDEQGSRLATTYEGEYRDTDFVADIAHIIEHADAYFSA